MNNEPEFTHLLPADEAEAFRRLEAVLALSPSELEGLANDRLLLAWWSFFWLHAALHPDDAEVWPEEVAQARPLADEAFRRYEAGELKDGEYYPAEVVRHRIQHERGQRQPTQPQPHPPADPSETGPQRPTLPNA
jgi:hypothetical protein